MPVREVITFRSDPANIGKKIEQYDKKGCLFAQKVSIQSLH